MAEATDPDPLIEPTPQSSLPPALPPPTGPLGAGRKPVLPRRSSMAVRLVAVGTALVLAMVIGFVTAVVVAPPSVEDLRHQAGLDERKELLVGVKNDQPGIASYSAGTGWTGFDIDIAYMIAEDLGFRRGEVRFLEIESEDRARMQATDTKAHQQVGVDLVIASYSITPDREAAPGVTFSAPYLYTEQSVVTRVGHRQVSTLEDLAGQRVCTLSTSTSESPLGKAHAVPVSRKTIHECFEALDAKTVDAVSTDAAILAGYKYRFPKKYTHFDIGLESTEAWGVNVGENDALRKLVNLTLFRSREDPTDHRWEDAYDRNLRVEVPANWPTPIASDQQPAVPDDAIPRVREWPWERIEK